MRRQFRRTIGTVLAVGLPLAASGAPAAARTTGNESFKGAIVTSGESGTRTVVSSVIAASGVFTGSGRVVEVDSRPGDPGNVNRDDLVFPQGTMHIRSTSQTPAMSLNPQTCVLTVRIKQATKIIGGTGRFRHATGTGMGTVRGWGVTARKPDGTCSQDAALLVEVDVIASRGTLSI
jgi:hypothetical protein